MKTSIEKGDLLVAKPSLLSDYSFNRVVILLADHTETGRVGFVLNKPLDITTQDIIPEIKVPFTVYDGGPVEQDNLFFIHNKPDLIKGSVAISKGLYWGGNFEEITSLLNNRQLAAHDIRFFLGYSGWGIGQLEHEITENSWAVFPNKFPNILAVANQVIWKDFIKKLGKKYAIWANAPSDPNWN